MKKSDSKEPIKIVILQRGWVFVGRLKKDKLNYTLENSYCIRQWGTTKGIGELVNGPTSLTKLDESGIVRFHQMSIVFTIDAEEDSWKDYC